MVKKLQSDIVENGVGQGDLVKFQNNVLDLINELQADAATNRTELLAIGTTLADFTTNFDLHTHTQQDGDGAQTSKADDTAEGVANAGTDVVFTDTSGGSVPPTLTNNTPLKLTSG